MEWKEARDRYTEYPGARGDMPRGAPRAGLLPLTRPPGAEEAAIEEGDTAPDHRVLARCKEKPAWLAGLTAQAARGLHLRSGPVLCQAVLPKHELAR